MAPSFQVWAKPLGFNRRAVLVLNLSFRRQEVPVRLVEELGFAPGSEAEVQEVWSQKQRSKPVSEKLLVQLEPHGSFFAVLQAQKRISDDTS